MSLPIDDVIRCERSDEVFSFPFFKAVESNLKVHADAPQSKEAMGKKLSMVKMTITYLKEHQLALAIQWDERCALKIIRECRKRAIDFMNNSVESKNLF